MLLLSICRSVFELVKGLSKTNIFSFLRLLRTLNLLHTNYRDFPIALVDIYLDHWGNYRSKNFRQIP